MNFGKTLIVLITLFAVLGTFSFASSLAIVSAQNETQEGGSSWISYNSSNIRMTALTATIHVTIKNTNDHVEIFKISQTYTSDLNTPINWTVDWTDPPASRMIDPVSPELGGDYGWEIQAGETKNVAFKLSAYGLMGSSPAWIYNLDAVDNTYWPLIPDMGLMSSWFMPNEIEMLNPKLDLQSWKSTFTFTATNFANYPVVGIIRAPIVPSDSKLTNSEPAVTYQDKELALNTNIAAWDVHLDPDQSEFFCYTYEWPIVASGSCNNCGNGSSNVIPTTAAKNATTVPSRTTGVPYGLLAIAVMIVAAGLGYAKFLR